MIGVEAEVAQLVSKQTGYFNQSFLTAEETF